MNIRQLKPSLPLFKKRTYKVPHNKTQQNMLIKGTILRSYMSAYCQLNSVIHNFLHKLDITELNSDSVVSVVGYIETVRDSLKVHEDALRNILQVCTKEESRNKQAIQSDRRYEKWLRSQLEKDSQNQGS